MRRLAEIEGVVNEEQYTCAVVASADWNAHLRAGGLGPTRHPATCECDRCEGEREEADAAYSSGEVGR